MGGCTSFLGVILFITSETFSSPYVYKEIPDIHFNLSSEERFEMLVPFSTFRSTVGGYIDISVSLSPSWVEWKLNNNAKVGEIILDTKKTLDVFVMGEYAYVAQDTSGIYIISISNKSNPVILESINTWDSDGVVCSEETMTCYLCDLHDGVKWIDVSDPYNPFVFGSLETELARRAVLRDQYLFLADGEGGVKFIDTISREFVGNISVTYAAKVFVEDNYIFIAGRGYGWFIYEISDFSNPVFVSQTSTYGEVWGISFKDNYVFTCEGAGGFFIYDVEDKGSPTVVGSLSGSLMLTGPIDAVINGDNAFIASGRDLVIVDVAEKNRPKIVQVLQEPEEDGNTWGIHLEGNFVYLAASSSGLKIYRLGDLELSGSPEGQVHCGNQTVYISARDCTGNQTNTSFNIIFSDKCAESNHGFCNENHNNCTCFDTEYYGAYCNEFDCFGNPKNDPDVCNSNGECASPNKCLCDTEKIGGEQCEILSCFGVFETDVENICSGHGVCISVDHCKCSGVGYSQSIENGPCDIWECGGFNKDSKAVCSGNGECVSPDVCSCDSPYIGSSCNIDLAAIIAGVVGGTFAIVSLAFCFLLTLLAIILCVCVAFTACCACGVYYTKILMSQSSHLKRFKLLDGFEMLLKEQLVESDQSIPHLRIDKSLYEIPMNELEIVRMVGAGGSNAKVFLARWKDSTVAFSNYYHGFVFFS